MGRGANATGARRRLFFALTLLIPIAFLALLYLGSVFARGSYFYYFYKVKQHAWVGEAWTGDPELGYVHARGFRGEQRIAPDIAVPIILDEEGHRVSDRGRETDRHRRPLVLAIGDSFTFGYGVAAEETFTARVADALGGTAVNASVMGYGMAQILLEARRLIPQLKPDILLMPHSRWLLNRASQGFSHTRFAAVPTPYFIADTSGPLQVAHPHAEAVVFDLGLQRHWEAPVGLLDFVSFLIRGALPVLVHRDFVTTRFEIELALGLLPAPLEDEEEMLQRAYREITRLAIENETRVIVVSLENDEPDPNEMALLRRLPDATVVDTWTKLWERLTVPSKVTYARAYHFWSDELGRIVDLHPNAAAHEFIAADILDAIGREGAPETGARRP